MFAPDQSVVRNRLLALMLGEDFERLAPNLEHLALPRGSRIADPDQPIEHVYFLESGVGSIIAISPEGHEVEAGLFGRDGFSPVDAILGSDRTVSRIVIQLHDDAWRIEVDALLQAVDASRSLRNLLLRYVHALSVQTAFTALSNAAHTIDERLARWLLMCDDRADNGELALTHEFISIMLAVRRPSVTTALHVLEGNGFIRAERGAIVIRDRTRLEDFARDAYGKPEAEYQRLIGPMR